MKNTEEDLIKADLLTEAKEKSKELQRLLDPILTQMTFARLCSHELPHTVDEFKELNAAEDYYEAIIKQLLGFTLPKHLR